MGFRLIGGPEGGRVRLSPYRPEWAERFAAERERIAAALGPSAERIEHVGSTSVPGLDAKPIVDILVAVADPADPGVCAALEATGYVLRVDEERHRMFRTPERDVHVHLWVAGTDDDHAAPRVPRPAARLRGGPACVQRAEAPARRARVGRHQRLRGGQGRADRGDPGASTGGLTCPACWR